LADFEGEPAAPGAVGSSAAPLERPPLAGVGVPNHASQNEGLGSQKNTYNTALTHLDGGGR
jgi:hypothetical protein